MLHHGHQSARAGNQAPVPDPAEAREAILRPGRRRFAGAGCRRTACSTPPTSGCGLRGRVLRIRIEPGAACSPTRARSSPRRGSCAKSARRSSRTGRPSSTSSSGSGSPSGSGTRSTARSSAPPTPSSRSTKRRSARSSRSKGSENGHHGDWPPRSAAPRPTTSSTPTAACTSSTARRDGIAVREHGVRRIGSRSVSCIRPCLLTAGLGTRLRPLSAVRAKPALPVAGEALVRRILGWLAASGVTDVVLNLHHRPETVCAVVGDGSDLGVRVRYSWENPVLGSGGRPAPRAAAARRRVASSSSTATP